MLRNAWLGLVGCFLVACQGAIGDGESRSFASGDSPGVPGSVGNPGADGPVSEGSTDGPPEDLVFVPPDDILGISEEDFESIPAELLIKASRDSCTSPCAVFFDASADVSWDEITASRLTWVFSDGATADGFMAARVFELPEGEPATTFEATLVVEQDGFLVARDTQTITVHPSQGRTICVSQGDFSGCPSADSADHFGDAGDAWDAIETDGRILFRRGDSFPSMDLSSTVSGPVQVGAFGDPAAARPALSQSGGSLDLKSKWSFTDLEISGGGMSGAVIDIDGRDTLVLRSHIHHAEKAFLSNGSGYDFSTRKFLFYNVVTDIDSTNYIGGDYIAIVGNHLERWGADHHTIRIGGGKHVLIANNATISDVGHSSVTVRGSSSGNRPGSDYVLVQGNLLMQKASVHPQNDSSNEWLRHVIWERNVHLPHDSQTSLRNGLNVNGDDMVIRNNVFYQTRQAITIETHPLAGASQNIHIYQNTHYVDEDRSSTHRFCGASSSGSNIVVEDNLAALYSNTESTNFVTGNATLYSNYVYTPSRTGECERPDGSGACIDPDLANTSDLQSPDFMMPRASSLAVDAATDAIISNDFHGTPRPQGGAPDIGAVEHAE